MERLDDAQRVDRAYHGAKLTAAAFNDPARIWTEHDQVRQALLQASSPRPAALDRTAHIQQALTIQQRMMDAGLIPTQ
jgi:hypothetical protein